MNQNKVSVLMSVYNEEIRWLSKAVDSILQQTYRNIEFVIVIDNPNNFEIISYLEKKQKEDGRIILLKNIKNEGLVSSLNKAFQASSGQYIARMDADDVSMKTRIEDSMDYLLNHQVDLVGAFVSKIDEEDQILETQRCTSISQSTLKSIESQINIITHPTWVSKREVFEKNKGYRHFFAMEDYDFILRAIEVGFVIDIVPKITLHYRVRGTSISQSNEHIQFLNAMILHRYNRKGLLHKAKPSDFFSKERPPSENQIKRYANMLQHSNGLSASGVKKLISLCLVLVDLVRYPEAREKVKTKLAVRRYNEVLTH